VGGQSPARTSLYWKESASPEFTTKVLDAVDVQLVPMAQRKHGALEQLRPTKRRLQLLSTA
jgi:hypothetical protein